MNKSIATAGALAALMLTSSPAAAVSPVTQATANAHVYKALQISFVQNLDFGALALASGSWTTQLISMDQAGTLTGCGGNVTCSGAAQPAKYHLFGTNNSVVKITAPPFNLNGPTTIAFTPNAPLTVNLGPGGLATGVDFSIGGSITLTSTTPEGLYTGNFAVTADYQ
ncbi:DUF4402 domain-containing protein [Sphingomonas sp.]|uniref:DUF4402 domain-containing protein n=1 Tax=Sphingomonas sp. TaxID=28214 RepID=UPI0038AAC6D0